VRSHGWFWQSGKAWLALSLGVVEARAADARAAEERAPEALRLEAAEQRIRDARQAVLDQSYFHWFGAAALGRGIRFNNPYRLEHVLGKTTRSLSVSALYADVSLGVMQGAPSGLQHGIGVDLAVALTGIRQEVLTPSYRAFYRLPAPWLIGGRFGVPVVLEPDVTGGVELAASAMYRMLANLGPYMELIGSCFFGAATLDQDRTTIPIVSLQIGVFADYEVFE